MSTTINPDQSEQAIQAITNALFTSTGVITHATARLIAAAIHGGSGTELERLAATGRFDPIVLRREVVALSVEPGRAPWRHALLSYVDEVLGRKHPWARSATRDH